MASKKAGLGLGLTELLGDSVLVEDEVSSEVNGVLRQLSTAALSASQLQPRKTIHSAAIEELSQSIAAQGILQPIIVRPITHNRYEIIAGERRWRAAKLAGLQEVPAIVREMNDQTALALALVENIQREDLNAIEEAEAMMRLSEEFSLTHQEIATIVGKSRSSVSNALRLLALADPLKKLLRDGALETGHARALLTLPHETQARLAQRICQEGLTVRQTEKLVRQLQKQPDPSMHQAAVPNQFVEARDKLQALFGNKFSLQYQESGKGKLVMKYGDLDELSAFVEQIARLKRYYGAI